MATLEEVCTGLKITLAARHLVGRSQTCLLRLDHRYVSAEHARFQWNGAEWELRDLGSRNGTFVDSRQLPLGESITLARGAHIRFGKTNEWLFIDDGPPQPMAVSIDGLDTVAGKDGVLVLPPDAECPQVTIYQTTQGEWWAERGDQLEKIQDHSVLTVESRIWRLHLPETTVGTWDAAEAKPTIETIGLRFAISSDEEYVEVAVLHGGQVMPLSVRAHHYPLLVLARARLRDQHDPQVPARARGWLYQDDLLKMLDITSGRLNLDIYRARQEFAALGIVSGASIVERRPSTRQLRLGVEHLELVEI